MIDLSCLPGYLVTEAAAVNLAKNTMVLVESEDYSRTVEAEYYSREARI